jgi:hypothetical protein
VGFVAVMQCAGLRVATGWPNARCVGLMVVVGFSGAEARFLFHPLCSRKAEEEEEEAMRDLRERQ